MGITSEMQLGHGLCPIDAIPHFDAVEIDLHDTMLAPDDLY